MRAVYGRQHTVDGKWRLRLALLVICCLLSAVYSPLPAHAQCAPPADGLIGHWTLDETSGSFIDSSGNGNHGTDTGGVIYGQAGEIGNAAGFDGTNYQIDIPTTGSDYALANSAATFVVWIKADPAQPEEWPRFIDRFTYSSGNYGYRFGMDQNGEYVEFLYGAQSGGDQIFLQTAATYNDGQWHHAVVTMDGSTARLYIDGKLDDEDNYALLQDIGSWSKIELGGEAGGSSLLGALDDVRIYNRALSAAEVAALYATRSTADAPAGYVTYDARHARLMYCDGTDWVHAGTGGYNPNAVSFDETNDYLSHNSSLGPAASTKWSGSFWIRRGGGIGSWQVLFDGNYPTEDLGFDIDDSNRLLVYAENAAGTAVLHVYSDAITDTDWHHIIFSFDLTDANKRHIYIDDVSALGSVAVYDTAQTMDFDQGGYRIGSRTSDSTLKFNGDLADVWLAFDTYIDLTIEANRRKFRSASGMPMYLGPDGSIPTGAAPNIFLSGGTDSWHTNKGTGGGFTETGALTTAASQPGDSVSGGGSGAATLTNSAFVEGTAASTGYTLNFGFTATAGRLLVLAVAWDKSITGPAVTGGGWTQVAFEQSGTSSTGAMYYRVADGSETSVSLTWTTSEEVSVWLGEYSGVVGVSPLDQSVSADSANLSVTNISTGTTAALAQADELVIAMVGVDSGGGLNTGRSWSNNFNEITYLCDSCDYAGDPGLGVAFKTTSATTGVETTYSTTDTGDEAVAILATFKLDTTITPGAASCSAAAQGKIIYNADFNVMTYCNGAEWVAMGQVGGTPPTSGLVALWEMDETSGTTASDSAGSNNGTMAGGLSGDTSSVAGQVTNALSFNPASSDRISVPTAAALNVTGDVTLAFWAKLNTAGNLDTVLSKESTATGDTPYHVEIRNSGTPHWTWYHHEAADTNWDAILEFTGHTIPVGVWEHVTLVRTVGTKNVTLYINGENVEAKIYGGDDPAASSTALMLGVDVWLTAARYIDGDLDDLRIYSRALSAAEVAQLYHYGLSGGIGDVSGNCASPSMPEGAMVYNATHNVLQYCNGEGWIGVGQ